MSKQEIKYNIRPIEEFKNKYHGHWFDADSKRFFNSRWDNVLYQNDGSIYAYFISSERNGYNNPRLYTIRRVNMRSFDFSSDFKSKIFNFQGFSTKREAYKFLREYLKTEDVKTDLIAWLKAELDSIRNYQETALQQKELDIESELGEIEKCLI